VPVPKDVVPAKVKRATALLAEYLSTTDPTTVNSSSNLKLLQADVVKLEFDSGSTSVPLASVDPRGVAAVR
jgi:uncharacterized protein HemX